MKRRHWTYGTMFDSMNCGAPTGVTVTGHDPGGLPGTHKSEKTKNSFDIGVVGATT